LDEMDLGLAHPLYKQVYDIVRTAVDQGETLSPKFFTSHSDGDIQKFAIDLLTDPYIYSDNWEEKLQAPLRTQKMPEENFEKDMIQAVSHFKQKVLEYQMGIVKEKLSESIENRDDQATDKYIKIQQHLIEIRKNLANSLGRVVL